MSENLAKDSNKWDLVIDNNDKLLDLNLMDVWKYRDLLIMFVNKDIITVYKQTVLGPIWFVIQPVLTTLIFTFIFGNIGKMAPEGVPTFIFFFGSVTLWNYFADTLNITSKTFIDNASIFGKVYFPRIVLPLSKILSGLLKFLIQFALFLAVWLYFLFVKKTIHPNAVLLLLPALLALMAAMSLGIGIIITSMTTKYRDLTFLIGFGVQLFMYATPVTYSLSNSKFKHYRFLLNFNPLSSVFEAFKYGFLGNGEFSWLWLGYSTLLTIAILIIGLIVFNKMEKRFIDTV